MSFRPTVRYHKSSLNIWGYLCGVKEPYSKHDPKIILRIFFIFVLTQLARNFFPGRIQACPVQKGDRKRFRPHPDRIIIRQHPGFQSVSGSDGGGGADFRPGEPDPGDEPRQADLADPNGKAFKVKSRQDFQHNDTHHNDTQHDDTQHNDTYHNDTVSIMK
jgi:hypothetical protein